MAGGDSSNQYDEVRLLYSPTWEIAFSAFVFIFISLSVERAFFFFGQKIKRGQNKDLGEALEKIKQELMVVGFISLALTIGQDRFAKICVPSKWIEVMLPCYNAEILDAIESVDSSTCPEGKSHFTSITGLHQLHIFLFILVVVHVLSSLLAMALARWKVHIWKAWEEISIGLESQHDHVAMRLTKQTTFVRSRWKNSRFVTYMCLPFRQLFHPVTEIDYRTLRNGFIQNHASNNAVFNFQHYILRTLNDDFKHIVGVSVFLWGYMIFWLLINFNGWKAFLVTSILPILLIFIIGIKLQHIITTMAREILDRYIITEGHIPNVTLSNDRFWFKSPKLILRCIHFILFQIAITISIQLWGLYFYKKDENSCVFHSNTITSSSLSLGMVSLVLCAYVTIPTYGLVSQMGDSVKRGIFDEHVREAIAKWHGRARNKISNHGESERKDIEIVTSET